MKKRLDCILKDERDPSAAYYYCKTNKCGDNLDFVLDKQIEKTKLDESKIKDVRERKYNQCVNTKCKKSVNAYLNIDRVHNKCIKKNKTYKTQKKCFAIIGKLYDDKSDCETKNVLSCILRIIRLNRLNRRNHVKNQVKNQSNFNSCNLSINIAK